MVVPKLGDRRPGSALHPWSGVLLLTVLTAGALLAATAGSQPPLWLMMGAIAGFAVSGST